jgi:hypothetical protein
MEVGAKITIPPIAPIEANTRRFDAGAVCFGVEYRLLNDAVVGEHMKENASPRAAREDQIDDSGVSIHVFGADGQEYLRFDCFREWPHYHYIMADGRHHLMVNFDVAAHGEPLDWTLKALRTRLGPMLRQAGAPSLAEAFDPAKVAEVMKDVERAARSAG